MNDKKVQLVGTVQMIDKDEVVKLVPSEILEDIKENDPNPMFAMMSIGNQGEAKGALFEGTPGMGKKLSSWYKQLWPLKAIKQLVKYMKPPSLIPVYENHPTGDPTEERVSVGTIVNGVKRVINGVTHAVAVAYINNYGTRKKIAAKTFNSCSLEATCLFTESKNLFKYVVDSVRDLTGIALCNSEVTPPGFKDANILAVVTAMAPPSNDDEDDEDEGKRKRSKKPMNIQEIKTYIKDHGVQPSVLFDVEVLTADAKVVDAFKADYEKQIDDITKERDDLKKEIEPLRKTSQKERVTKLIENSDLLKDEYKEVVSFLKQSLSVDISEVENPQEVVDKAIENQLAIMKSTGMKTKFSEQKDNKTGDKKEHPDKKEEQQESDENDMTNPENNELIPKD